MSVPNQKIIQNFNYEPCDTDNLYAKINLDALQKVLTSDLTLNAIKMWIYLSKNKQGYTNLELSRQDCINWGIGRTQYTQTIQLLLDKGYLVSRGKGSNRYDFYQIPVIGGGGQEKQGVGPGAGQNAKGPVPDLDGKNSPVPDPKSLLGSAADLFDNQRIEAGPRPKNTNLGSGADLKGTGADREILYNTTINITDTDSLSPNGDKESYTAATISFDEFKRMKEEGSYQVDMEDQWFLYVSLKDSKNRFRFMKEF